MPLPSPHGGALYLQVSLSAVLGWDSATRQRMLLEGFVLTGQSEGKLWCTMYMYLHDKLFCTELRITFSVYGVRVVRLILIYSCLVETCLLGLVVCSQKL